uniref:Putative chemosensory protein CSP10 n=2 Tax=Solenopsis invicta TaxID=13686 RepID=B7TVH8_SOLIN|nr:putative chemosensory protein CSP10 [Solenopsis invicta]
MNVLMCVFGEELELYPREIDDIDVLKILSDDAWRRRAEDCYFKRVPCAKEKQYLSDIFKDMLKTKCEKCTEKQKKLVKTATEWYEQNEPDTWKLILEDAHS